MQYKMPSFQIFLYNTKQYEKIECNNENCDIVCRQLCQKLNIRPTATLLFSLRVSDTVNFLPGCQNLVKNQKYEFRMRYQVPILANLMELDKVAYNYYYLQVKSDLIFEKITELEYPNHKDKVVGLCVTSMYNDMLEFKISAEELEKNYKNYLPKKYVKKHSFIIKDIIAKELKNIKYKQHDTFYVKGTYLESIKLMAPNYFVERCCCVRALNPKNDDLQKDIELEFSPYHTDRPGLSSCFSKKNWKHISKIEDIFAITVEQNNIKFQIRDNPAGFSAQILDKQTLESFVSCIAGYYRLMVKWTVDLYTELASPSLKMLKSNRCHGPVGGEFSYTKLEEKHNFPGSYLIRQCEMTFDTYYIDIIIKNNQTKTFEITYKNNMWHLHTDGLTTEFGTISELANSIHTESKGKFRLAPSEYDKSELLLLCMPPIQLIAKKAISEDITIEMRKKRPHIFYPDTDFRKYIDSGELTNNGMITEMRADWVLPNNKKLEVTLKILNTKEDISKFMRLADKWSNLYSPELIKMYGVTLSNPYILVIESTKLGPLDVFLSNTKTISVVSLIDAAYSLARALYYLQENNIIHGKIRCASLRVIKYESPNLLVRLGDPGFLTSYTPNDKPWIPVEYYNKLEHAKFDYKSEIWAYATTLWEIFSRGMKPNSKQNIPLSMPQYCPEDIYNIMLEGWDPVPDRRFSPQDIFARLIGAMKANIDDTRFNINIPDDISTNSSTNGSIRSTVTERTHLNSESTISHMGYTDYEHELPINWYPTTEPTIIASDDTNSISSNDNVIIEMSGKEVILQGKIGEGHYGIVSRGQIEEEDGTVTKVAIKQMNGINNKKDFGREMNIMRDLQHPNIVKIIGFSCGTKPSIIMEYVEHRCFSMYLKWKSPKLSTQILLKFTKDIASGMEYLVSKYIIHRDLAARNVLIGSNYCVKISDFGLAQVANANGYYRINTEREIPLKWHPPESLKTNKYYFKSDVWSFGVTLFEMFSHGQQPDLENGVTLSFNDQLKRLEEGQRLHKPDQCPENIYNDLLMICWRENRKERPTFTEILTIVNNFITEYGEAV